MAASSFSVIIPTCNRPALLAECLSALSAEVQSLPNNQIEVIVTDDSTGTESRHVCQEHFPWSRWTQGPRRGPAANRNSGGSQASGKWFVFIDDDCLPNPNLLSAYRQAIADGHLVYEGKTTCDGWRNDPLETAPVNETGGYLWSCNMMIEAALFKELGGFDERFPFAGGEDVEFRERLGKLNIGVDWVPEAVVDHPPRARNLFLKAARREESQIPLLLLRGEKNPYRKLVPYTLKTGLKGLYRTRLSGKWIVAAASLAVQSTGMLFMLPRWRRRYGFSYEHPSKGGLA